MTQKQELMGVVYRKATLGEILALREEVLIRGTDRDSAEFEGDLEPTTFHMGAFHRGRNIACLTLFKSEYEGESAYQLRGMAVVPDLRNQGIGKSLTSFSERWILRHSAARVVWCNARTSAVEYYLRQKWEQVSDPFEVKGVGPHVRMVRQLDSVSPKVSVQRCLK